RRGQRGRGRAGRRGAGARRAPAGRHAVAAERRDPRRGAAPLVSPRARRAAIAGPGDGTRPGERAGRGQDPPGRLESRRPGRPATARRRRGRPRDRPMAGGAPVTGRLEDESYARAALTYLAEPGDGRLGALLRMLGAARTLEAIKAGRNPGAECDAADAMRAALPRATSRWQVRLARPPSAGG